MNGWYWAIIIIVLLAIWYLVVNQSDYFTGGTRSDPGVGWRLVDRLRNLVERQEKILRRHAAMN